MVVQTADQAVSNAKATTSCDAGMCLWQTQEWMQSPHVYPDATAQWHGAARQHPGDRNPPRGAPVFYTGGSSGHGHACISLGDGKIRSTDCTSTYHVSDTDLGWPERTWGLKYAGWTEDIGNVDVPYLVGGGEPQNPNDCAVGDLVYVVADGELNARDAPNGDVVGSLPYGSKITIAEIVDGWARAEAASRVESQDQDLVPVYATQYLKGVDVSSYQENWAGLKDDEFYGFVKATEGRSYVNPEHDYQVSKIRSQGKQVGHYHWLTPGNIQDQVNYFLDHAQVQPGDIIACDWEDSGQPTCAEKDQWIKAVQDHVDGANKVGLYCNRTGGGR